MLCKVMLLLQVGDETRACLEYSGWRSAHRGTFVSLDDRHCVDAKSASDKLSAGKLGLELKDATADRSSEILRYEIPSCSRRGLNFEPDMLDCYFD